MGNARAMPVRTDRSVSDLVEAIKVADRKRMMAQARIASIRATLRRLDELAEAVDGRL
jgi:hypothetical protein